MLVIVGYRGMTTLGVVDHTYCVLLIYRNQEEGLGHPSLNEVIGPKVWRAYYYKNNFFPKSSFRRIIG